MHRSICEISKLNNSARASGTMLCVTINQSWSRIAGAHTRLSDRIKNSQTVGLLYMLLNSKDSSFAPTPCGPAHPFDVTQVTPQMSGLEYHKVNIQNSPNV
jgi:hypothetical protein